MNCKRFVAARQAIDGMENIKGKNAIVTGGTRGIGLAVAKTLLEGGARVLICSRKTTDVESRVAELREQFGDVVFGIACDVANSQQVRQMFAYAEKDLGGVDLLINNAGVGDRKSVV